MQAFGGSSEIRRQFSGKRPGENLNGKIVCSKILQIGAVYLIIFARESHHMTVDKHIILYAEDDLDDLFLVKQAFEKHDHIHVVHAPDGRKALNTLEEMVSNNFLPCLVILDINMPVMNGKEALQAIRDHPTLNRLPVILFSTSNSPTDISFARSLNADLITKPIEYADLEHIATQFVEQCNFEINKLSAN